jgi:hypothetical protein
MRLSYLYYIEQIHKWSSTIFPSSYSSVGETNLQSLKWGVSLDCQFSYRNILSMYLLEMQCLRKTAQLLHSPLKSPEH